MEKNKKIHIIGVCGKGTSALALILKGKGWIVTGSDKEFYEPIFSILKKNKIKIYKSYSAKNIPKDVDLVVLGGRHANLAPENNEEVHFAKENKLKIKSVPEVLGEIANKTENTIVAGSFGKSTVTTLLTHCLVAAGKDPSYFIGGAPIGWKTNAKLGKGKDFIIEGDEFPSSNLDSTSKFLYLKPKNVILVSAEHDHRNIFPKEEDYLKTYRTLVGLLPKNGTLVVADEGKNISKVIKNAKCEIVKYGLNKKSIWHAENIKYGSKTTFDLYNGPRKIVGLETRELGNHNIENIVGVAAFLLEKKLLGKTALQRGIKTYKGLAGRLDLKNKKGAVRVYEGFGSSYTKAKSVFNALKLHFPDKKLITIFEPHSGSWSHKLTKFWYKDIFETTDKLILLPPPAFRRGLPGQMNFKELVAEVRKYKKEIYPARGELEALRIFKKIVKKGSVVVLVSSGSLLGLKKSIPSLTEKLF